MEFASTDEIALSKLAFMVCIVGLVVAASARGAAQGALSQVLPGSTTQQQEVPISPIGQVPLQLQQFQGVSTTITNVSPAQDRRDQELLQSGSSVQQSQGSPTTETITKASKVGGMATAPREPDLEFQEFVANALGANLAVFGQNLFENVPSTFAPLDRVQVPADYVLGPGDELLIRAWGQIDINYQATIDRTGAIYIPKVGALNIAGVKYSDAHDFMQTAIGRVFKNFQVSVSMGHLRAIQVFVVGMVKRPGTYTISSLSTLLDALFASGGPSNRGSLRRIQVKRDSKPITTFDLYDLIVNGDKSKDVKLLPGDVIYVPPVGPLVALAGSINTPAVFELLDHSPLSQVVSYAGGLTNTASGESVVIERIAPDHKVRQAEEFPLDQEGLARELRDGDVVRIRRIPSKFDNAVTLRGNVALPGRYSWRQGMRVHDLIPSREFLVTDEYWKHQNQLAVVARAGDFRINPAELKNDVQRMSSEINWKYAVIQRMNPQDLNPRVVPFNLGLAIDGDAQQNLELQPNDVITVFSQTDLQVPIAERTKFVHLEGEFKDSGVYQVQEGETLRHLVQRVGGVTSQAYLFGSEFTRESTRVNQQQQLDQYVNSLDQSVRRNAATAAYVSGPSSAAAAQAQTAADRGTVERLKTLQSTGRIVLELKPSAKGTEALPDLVLEDGDRLLIPFRPATVNVIGSVYNSSAFIYKPGKTVADYLRLAGGPARGADRGREFVVRADGSTVGRQQHNFLLAGRDFAALRLMPGDTIIVPTKLDRGATLRALRDWATILGQFGLAAGGIRTLFP